MKFPDFDLGLWFGGYNGLKATIFMVVKVWVLI